MALDGGTVVIEVIGKYKDQLSPGIDNADKRVDKFEQSLLKIEKDLDKLGSKKTDLKVEDKASKSINNVMQSIKKFSGQTFKATVRILDYATKPLQAIKSTLFSMKGLVAAIGSGIAANQLIMNPINLADTIESAQIGFENQLGSAEAAIKKMDEIKQFAAKTPFDTMGVVSGVQMMMNSGWNADNVMADMEILGDAAAATGNTTEGLSRIITAFSQMRMSGRVGGQDMMQLTNANIGGWKLLAEGLGTDIQTVRKMAENGDIDAETGIAAIMAAMKENYSGTMQANSARTVSGIMSNVKDTFDIKILERWGRGLQSGVIDGLSTMADFLDEIDPVLQSAGDALFEMGAFLSGKFSSYMKIATDNLKETLNSEEFKNASFWGKAEMIWDDIIGDPFREWWDTSGRKLFIEKANSLGKWLGEGVTSGLLAILGIDATGATADGVSIGKSFTEGFIDGIDGEAIKEAFLSAFKKIGKDALKVLPGGDSPEGSSWVSALLLGGLGYKLGGGKLLGKLGSKLSGSWGKTFGATTDDVLYQSWLKTNANPNSGKWFSKLTGKVTNLSWVDDLLTSGGKTGTVLGKLGKFGKGVGKFAKGNWLSLLFSGAAIATSDDKVKTTVEQGGGLAGSAAGGALGGKIGAAIGSFIAPGAGTAIGGGIGSLIGSTAGYIFGEKGAGKLWDGAKKWLLGDTKENKDGSKSFGGAKGQISELWTEIKEDFSGLADSAKEYFTTTLPEQWDGLVESAGTFFTETLPYEFGRFIGNAGIFFTETLPEWWNNSIEAAGVFFTETLPEWWNTSIESAGTFFTETLPEWWNGLVEGAGVFFTETLPEWWNTAVDSLTTFWTEDVPAYWNGKVDEIAEGWQAIKDKWSSAIDTITGWFSEKYESVSKAYDDAKDWLDNKWEKVKENYNKGKEEAEGEHANGGIFSRPHLGLVAEDGPEAIIPLGSKRRQRGLDLWRKAGAAMGVTAYAEGGIVGKVQTGGGSITVDVGGVHIHVDGGNATLLEALNSQSEEIKEAIAGILYSALSQSFNNMPVTV